MDALFQEIADISGIKIEKTGQKTYSVSSTDPDRLWAIPIVKDAVYPETGSIWDWLIGGQYFDEKFASGYLVRLVAEKQTGIRILRYERGSFPMICGNGIDCRAEHRDYFTMLCSHCPKAEQMQAEKDGVTLSYQPETE